LKAVNTERGVGKNWGGGVIIGLFEQEKFEYKRFWQSSGRKIVILPIIKSDNRKAGIRNKKLNREKMIRNRPRQLNTRGVPTIKGVRRIHSSNIPIVPSNPSGESGKSL